MVPGIREKVLASFVVLSLIPLLFLGAISGYEMHAVGDRSVTESSAALGEQAETHLVTTAKNKAAISNDFFVRIQKDTCLLQSYANDVFTDPQKYGSPNYPWFRYTTGLAPNLPAYGYQNASPGQGNGAWADWDHRLASSPYINRSMVARAASDPAYGAFVSAELNSTMLLDKVLKPAYERNQPDVVAAWFVRSGGISTSYQVPPLDWGALLSSGEKTPAFDESLEEYFLAATPARDPARKAVWVGPYYDTVGNGWMISCVAPVYRSSEFIGVTGIDVSLDVVVSTVLDISLMKTGHAFLIDGDANTIAHKDLAGAMEKNDGKSVPVSRLETDSDSFGAVIETMKSGLSGFGKVTYRDGSAYYISYAPLDCPGFSLGVVIPQSEVTRPVLATQNEITATTGDTILKVAIVDIIAILLAVVLGYIIADRIVRPIKRLTDLALRIGTGELDERLFDGKTLDVEDELTDRRDEIGDLAKSFETMIETIRDDIKKTPKNEIKIEIKDSVINRSFTDMGDGKDEDGKPVNTKSAVKAELEDEAAPDGVVTKPLIVDGNLIARDKIAPGQDASAVQAISCCPYCGRELNYSKPPRFCPFCKEKLS